MEDLLDGFVVPIVLNSPIFIRRLPASTYPSDIESNRVNLVSVTNSPLRHAETATHPPPRNNPTREKMLIHTLMLSVLPLLPTLISTAPTSTDSPLDKRYSFGYIGSYEDGNCGGPWIKRISSSPTPIFPPPPPTHPHYPIQHPRTPDIEKS